MIRRTYECNLCRDMSREPMGRDLIGLYWTIEQTGWVEKPPRDVETHICHKCLSSLKAVDPEATRDE